MPNLTPGAQWAITELERLITWPEYAPFADTAQRYVEHLRAGTPIALLLAPSGAPEYRHAELTAILTIALGNDAEDDRLSRIERKVAELDRRTLGLRRIG